MYNIVKLIIYKLWSVASLTLILSLFVLWWLGSLFALAVFTFGLAGMFYNAQDFLLYYPNDPPDSREFVLQPSNYKLPYESIKIKNKDGFLIHLFLIKQEKSKEVSTLVFLHGNAGNMGQRLSNVSGIYHKLQVNVLMLEYRGYGLSEGTPTESGLYVDAQSALDYLVQREDIDNRRIVIFGRSLGGAVAIDLAAHKDYKNKIWALIVENTFTSIPEMARIILRWKCLNWMPLFIHKNKYLSINKMGNIMMPTLIMCGSNDTLVPPSMAKVLFDKCKTSYKHLVIISGGGHNDTWTCREYYPSVQKFLLDVPAMPKNAEPYYDECEPSKIQIRAVHIV